MEWIPVSPALSAALGTPGLPKGYFILSRGFSNTGKSTSLLECVRGCQQLGILPIIIDTETNISWKHAKTMGVEVSETIDEETGEIKYGVSEESCMYIDCDYLINNYGKKRHGKTRQVAAIEDVAEFMNDMLNRQAKGELPVELCFLWDSAGTLDCDKGIESNSSNNQWNAGAMELAFKSLVNQRIPLSRGLSKEYTNTFFVVNKVWLDNMGQGKIKHKGGESFYYACRFLMHFGGIQSHGTKRLTATFKGRNYTFGTQSKVGVDKNQITDTVYDGTPIVSTAHGFIGADNASVAAYMKEHKQFLINQLGVSNEVNGEEDVEFGLVETDLPDSMEA